MFQSSRLEGLLNQPLSVPPIPFENGVDFWLNCPVCLVKLIVFKLCHLGPPVTPNSVAEGCQLSTLLVWWPIAGLWKSRKRSQRGFNVVSLCCNRACYVRWMLGGSFFKGPLSHHTSKVNNWHPSATELGVPGDTKWHSLKTISFTK